VSLGLDNTHSQSQLALRRRVGRIGNHIAMQERLQGSAPQRSSLRSARSCTRENLKCVLDQNDSSNRS
jgi:hypothetical protein